MKNEVQRISQNDREKRMEVFARGWKSLLLLEKRNTFPGSSLSRSERNGRRFKKKVDQNYGVKITAYS